MFKLFRGGIHPADGKTLAREAAIETMPAPALVALPLSQHIGAPCEPVVKVGEQVKRGIPGPMVCHSRAIGRR